MPLPLLAVGFGIGAAALQTGKLAFDIASKTEAIDESGRRQEEAITALENDLRDMQRMATYEHVKRVSRLGSLLAASQVSFAANNVMGGASVGAVQQSIARGLGFEQGIANEALQTDTRRIRQRQSGLREAGLAERKNLRIGIAGDILGTGGSLAKIGADMWPEG